MKSKDKIVQSLIELMKTHEFEEITVKNISELAEVNRTDPRITAILNQRKIS